MKRVVFVGSMPPPLGGQSYVNQEMAKLLDGKCDLQLFDISASALDRSNFSYHVGRIKKVLRAAYYTLVTKADDRRFYMSSESRLGLVYMLVLVSLARVRKDKIFLHYHSFTFVDRKSQIMGWIVRAAGPRAVHIFLCPAHRSGFLARYPRAGVSRIVSNAWIMPPSEPGLTARAGGGRLCIGLISHLGPDKGLPEFIALMDRIHQLNLPIDGVLAGPPVTPADKSHIEAAVARLHPRLDYRGPTYGEDKIRFYMDIDALIFPTRFAVETQPMVIFEAFSYGRPVITFARGCIEGDTGESGSLVLPSDGDFVGAALECLQRWLADPASLAQAQAAASAKFRFHHDAAFTGRDAIVQEITG